MTILRALLRSIGLVAALFAAGCSGSQILDLNTDLVRLQDQKRTIEQRPRDGAALAQLVHIEGEFERLANSSYEAIARAPDSKSKIFYFRISATADWQRGSERAIPTAREGSAYCNANNGLAVSPRDCAVLAILPNLAVNDLWIKRLGAVERDMRTPGGPGRYRDGVNHLVASYVDIDAAIARFSGTGVTDDMMTVMTAQRRIVGANVRTLVDLLINNARTPADQQEMVAICVGIQRDAPAIPLPRCDRIAPRRA